MLVDLDAWQRFLNPQLWRRHLITIDWLIFTVVLFVLEPLFLHRWFQEQAMRDSDGAFRLLHAMHIILMTISLVAIFDAAGDVCGFVF